MFDFDDGMGGMDGAACATAESRGSCVRNRSVVGGKMRNSPKVPPTCFKHVVIVFDGLGLLWWLQDAPK